jgi:hypothetical protein
MGTWGPGSFENDVALDWVLRLGKSGNPDLPAGVLRRLDGAGSLGGIMEEEGTAAAEAVAASRGWPADRVPDGVQEWLRASGTRADAAIAELALRVIDAIKNEDSDLRLRWGEGEDVSSWLESMADLRHRLRAPQRDISGPPRPAKVQSRTGDVAQLLTSGGRVAYIQLIGRTDAPAFDMIRVIPGFFMPPLIDSSLAVLAGGGTAFLTQGSFRGMLTIGGCVARGNYQVPSPYADPQPLKLRPLGSRESDIGPVKYRGQTFSAEEFARLHPDIDQTMLADGSIVCSPGKLLRKIECEWQPWMGNDDRWMQLEGPGLRPQRPAVYPVTAQPGKFVLSE